MQANTQENEDARAVFCCGAIHGAGALHTQLAHTGFSAELSVLQALTAAVT
jgi:hypothetical protein